MHPRRASLNVEAYFNELAAAVDRALAAGERHATSFSAEETDFVRLNRGKVRQPGHVAQRYIEIRLIRGARHASHAISLSGKLATDVNAVEEAVVGLRGVLPDLADDPHLSLPSDGDVERHRAGRPAARFRSDRRNGVARRQRPGPRRPPRRGPGLSRIREFRRAAKLARHHDIQPAMEPLLSHRQGGQGVVLRLRLERSGPE